MARFVFTHGVGERIPGVWLSLEQLVARFVFTRGVGERIPSVSLSLEQ